MANENGLHVKLEFEVKDVGHEKTYNKISILNCHKITIDVLWHVLETYNNLGFGLNQSKILQVRSSPKIPIGHVK